MKNLALFSLILLMLISCEELENPADNSASSKTSLEILELDNALNILNSSGELAMNQVQFKGDLGYDVSISGTEFPRTLSIDYRDGYSPIEGVTFKGIVHINSTDLYSAAQSMHTMTFEEFHINERLLEGSSTTTNQGYAEGSQYPTYGVIFENGRLSGGDQPVVEFSKESNRTRLDDLEWAINMSSQWETDQMSLQLSSQERLIFNKADQRITEGLIAIKISEALTLYWDFEEEKFSFSL